MLAAVRAHRTGALGMRIAGRFLARFISYRGKIAITSYHRCQQFAVFGHRKIMDSSLALVCSAASDRALAGPISQVVPTQRGPVFLRGRVFCFRCVLLLPAHEISLQKSYMEMWLPWNRSDGAKKVLGLTAVRANTFQNSFQRRSSICCPIQCV